MFRNHRMLQVVVTAAMALSAAAPATSQTIAPVPGTQSQTMTWLGQARVFVDLAGTSVDPPNAPGSGSSNDPFGIVKSFAASRTGGNVGPYPRSVTLGSNVSGQSRSGYFDAGGMAYGQASADCALNYTGYPSGTSSSTYMVMGAKSAGKYVAAAPGAATGSGVPIVVVAKHRLSVNGSVSELIVGDRPAGSNAEPALATNKFDSNTATMKNASGVTFMITLPSGAIVTRPAQKWVSLTVNGNFALSSGGAFAPNTKRVFFWPNTMTAAATVSSKVTFANTATSTMDVANEITAKAKSEWTRQPGGPINAKDAVYGYAQSQVDLAVSSAVPAPEVGYPYPRDQAPLPEEFQL